MEYSQLREGLGRTDLLKAAPEDGVGKGVCRTMCQVVQFKWGKGYSCFLKRVPICAKNFF